MGFLDKVKFWKREDDFDFDKIVEEHSAGAKPGFEKDELGLGHPDLGLEEKSPFPDTPISGKTTSAYTPPLGGSRDRELELINSKLDTLKALLTSIDQRLANVERASGEKKERLW